MFTTTLTRLTLLTLLPTSAFAVSNGHTFECNARGNFGCSAWEDNDRMKCTEPIQERGIMFWVARPVHTPKYTLTASSGVDSYVPGSHLSLFLTVKDYDWKYRGLFVHAVNANNETVGRFTFPGGADKPQLFWEPPGCPGRLIHNSAELKPFVVELFFVAPPPGTGPISFHALIKKGEPNEGYFYYPNAAADGDLALREEVAATTTPALVAAEPRQSCTAFCAAKGLACDAATLRSATASTPSGLLSLLGGRVACRRPLIQSCSPAAPAVSDEASAACYFYAADSALCSSTSSATAATANSGSCAAVAHDAAKLICDALAPNTTRRFCACTAVGGGRRLATQEEASQETKGNAAPRINAPSSWGLALVLAAAARLQRKQPALLLVALLLFFYPLPSAQHNWMLTPARARSEASTTMPCRMRKVTDTHAQIGPNQSFVMKWATGHVNDGGREYTLIVVVHDSEYSWLAHPDFDSMVNDYIDSAPPGVDVASNPTWARYHGVNKDSGLAGFETFLQGGEDSGNPEGLGPRLFTGRKLQAEDDDFLDHTFQTTTHLFEYNTTTVLAKDRSVSYASSDYPWLISAARYPHYYTRPSDYDAIRVRINATLHGHGPGHYIVHYRWKGYYDCVDVDVFDVNVTHVDGQDKKAYVWNKEDHCQYVEPREIVTRCHAVTSPQDGPEKCVAELTNHRSEKRCGTDCTNRYGINVVPYENPRGVLFPDSINIPWGNQTCANSDWTLLTHGTASHSALAWDDAASWPHVRLNGTRCVTQVSSGPGSKERQTTLRRAVFDCAGAQTCAGVSVLRTLSNNSDQAPSSLADMTLTYRTCMLTVAADSVDNTSLPSARIHAENDTAWTTFLKPTALLRPKTPLPGGAATTFTISFQNLGWESELGPGWLADTGEVFGSKAFGGGTLDFGWSCPVGLYVKKGTTPTGAASFPMYIRGRTSGFTVNNTYVNRLESGFCPVTPGKPGVEGVGSRNEWRIVLPAGVWKVETAVAAGNRFGSCTLNNVQLATADKTRAKGQVYSRLLEIQDGDGPAVLQADANGWNTHFKPTNRCDGIAWIRFTRVGTALPQAWAPSSRGSGGAWWQLDLGSSTSVGLVTIMYPHNKQKGSRPGTKESLMGTDCRVWWLMRGDRCDDQPIGGWMLHTGDRTGVDITVSDVPCSGQACGGASATCGPTPIRVPATNSGASSHGKLVPAYVNCNGASGRYVRIYLPGRQRIFDATVMVNKPKGDVVSGLPNATYVCYGVEARAYVDSSTPEFLITHDPLDPKFYSTCYTRERATTFLPPPGAGSSLVGADIDTGFLCSDLDGDRAGCKAKSECKWGDADDVNEEGVRACLSEVTNTSTTFNEVVTDSSSSSKDQGELAKRLSPSSWDFNGHCLSCASYDANRPPLSIGRTSSPRWAVAEPRQCMDCDLPATDSVQLGGCSATFSPPLYALETTGVLTAGEGIISSSECFRAVASLGHAASKNQTGQSRRHPPGCSLVRQGESVSEAFFNTQTSSRAKCGDTWSEGGDATGAGASANATETASGSTSAKIGVSIAMAENENSGHQEVEITVWGPSLSVWFGVAFNAFAMSDKPYALVVFPDATVAEWKLGRYVQGTELSSMVTVTHTETIAADGEAQLRVTMRRAAAGATGKHQSFQAGGLEMPFIAALGSTPHFQHHKHHANGQTRFGSAVKKAECVTIVGRRTPSPTTGPSTAPTSSAPTATPSRTPTKNGETWKPSQAPASSSPTSSPISNAPTASPTLSDAPTAAPTTVPTWSAPSAVPTMSPSPSEKVVDQSSIARQTDSGITMSVPALIGVAAAAVLAILLFTRVVWKRRWRAAVKGRGRALPQSKSTEMVGPPIIMQKHPGLGLAPKAATQRGGASWTG